MIVINRQKFLTELARLLTFMYEEDRQTALELYNDMFDDAEDEQALIQYLVSPTRQAVLLARVYDTRERKLHVQSQSMDDDAGSGAAPSFIGAVLEIRDGAPLRQYEAEDELPPVRQEEKGQISLFGEDNSDECADEPEAAAPVSTDAPAEDAADGQEEAVDSSVAASDDGSDAPDADSAAPEPAETTEEPAVPPAAQSEEKVEPDEEKPAPVSAYDALAGVFPEAAEKNTKRVPRTGLLILYIILAVPVTLLGLLVLLVPTLVCLSCAVGVVTLGVFGVSAAFAGFTVFADILLVMGLSVIVLAFGLLFAWLFIWFIIGPMVSLVKGIISLGDKWCYKEVEL